MKQTSNLTGNERCMLSESLGQNNLTETYQPCNGYIKGVQSALLFCPVPFNSHAALCVNYSFHWFYANQVEYNRMEALLD